MKEDIIAVFFFCLVLCECLKNLVDVVPQKDPDEDRNGTELITSKGYPVEEYSVQTSDGYILYMQRIPYGRNCFPRQSEKKVVLLVHGLLITSDTYVINFPCQSLGFLLADRGYDVWLGNTRGNTYSRKHVKYTTNQRQFWNFSFTEMGMYDLPAIIDFVLEVTGEEKLYYIGYSQGTAASFVLLSERPEYNEKIRLLICLAPIAFVGHLKGPIRALAPYTNDIEFFFKTFGYNEFLPNDAATKAFKELFCNPMDAAGCEDIFFSIFASDKKQLNQTRVPVYVSHFPAGSSTKSVAHFGQLINSKKFRKYDYRQRNMHYYQQETPPDFDLSAITARIALLRGQSDRFATPEDISILRSKLNSVVCNYRVRHDLFNHIDFILAEDAYPLLHKKILSLLKRYY